MAVTAYNYGAFAKNLLAGNIDIDADTIKVGLCTSSYTPDQDADEFYDDITNEVANGNGYTTGGETLGSKTNTQSQNVVTFDAADTTWSSSTITARYAFFYKDTGTPATSPLIAYVDFGEDKSSENSEFKLTYNASGINVFTATDA